MGALAAPSIIKTPGLIMPVKPLSWREEWPLFFDEPPEVIIAKIAERMNYDIQRGFFVPSEFI